MVRRAVLGFAVVCAAIAFVPAAAGAAPTVINGPCEGSGAFQKGGFTVNATETGTVEVPRTDDVSWTGSITGVTGDNAYSGSIEVELPPPFGSMSIDSWSGTTDATSNSGVKHYDIPGAVPANVEFTVKGSHSQGTASCSGHVTAKIKGSSVNAFSVGSVALTLLTGLGLLFAGRAKGGI
ncbi:MAG TPA: hypothetical protein VFV00_13210 [Acidimicrobiales bacterium]|nr:hypothetical protein [Acidimicrobiales bacterium]